VQSAVKEMVTGSISNINKIINITLGVNTKFSDKADIGGQAGLDHTIRFTTIFGKDVIVLDPSANLYAGTQKFTQTYYLEKNYLFLPVAADQVTINSSRFNILAYEFSMPVVYAYKKFNLVLSPAYVIPENILTTPNQPSLSERGANLFYFTAMIKFIL
jgi:hypothetical protein